jgi:hypothetical protein
MMEDMYPQPSAPIDHHHHLHYNDEDTSSDEEHDMKHQSDDEDEKIESSVSSSLVDPTRFSRMARSHAVNILTYLCWIWLGYLTHSLNVSFLSALYFCSVSPSESAAHCVLYVYLAAPLLLCSTRVWNSVMNYRSIWIALSMTSFLPYYFSMQHFAQGVFVGLGFSALIIVQYYRFSQTDKDVRRSSLWAFLTGLVVLLFVRYTNYSVNPLFTNFGFSVFALVFTLVCAVFLWYAENYEEFEVDEAQVSLRRFSASQRLYMSFANNIDEELPEEVEERADDEIPMWRRYLPEVGTGLCLGACLFLINMFFTGYSVLPRWAGLEPWPFALISVFCLTVGILLGAMQILHNILTWIVLVVSVGLLCFAPPTASFLGGCLIALLTPAFLFASVDLTKSDLKNPVIISSVVANVFLSLFVRIVIDPTFAHFVIFGRPWIPLLVACLFLGLSFSSTNGSSPSEDSPSMRDPIIDHRQSKSSMFRLPPRLCFLALFVATLVGFLPSTMIRAGGKVPMLRSRPLIPLTPVGMKKPATNDTPTDPDIPVKPFSVVQFNIRQGYDEGGFTNLERILQYVDDHDHPSIVGLQEIETNYMWTGSIDVVEFLSYKLHMYTVYGSSPRESSLGAAILTKFQIHSSDANCFSSPDSQASAPTSCASAFVKFFNRSSLSPLDVFVSQTRQTDGLTLDQSRDIEKQISQVPPDHAVLWLGEITFQEDQSVPTTVSSLNSIQIP